VRGAAAGCAGVRYLQHAVSRSPASSTCCQPVARVGGSLNQAALPCLAAAAAAAGLQRLAVRCSSGWATSLSNALAPLTRLTALDMTFWGTVVGSSPLPADLVQLTALRELRWFGLSNPSPHELRSLLSPLTRLTALKAPLDVHGSCGLPHLPSLQSLTGLHSIGGGGLALLAASCPALVSLDVAWRSFTVSGADAAACLPALTRLSFQDGIAVSNCGPAFSLGGCAPALHKLSVSSFGRSAPDPSIVVFDRLRGLSQLHSFHAQGFKALVMGTREWQVLATLPALRSFDGRVQLEEGRAPMAACTAFCTQLTELRLSLPGNRQQLPGQARCCVQLAAAMKSSCVQDFDLSWDFPSSAVQSMPPRLPPSFWEHLAAWRCLSRVRVVSSLTAQQLSLLCASPTVRRVRLDAGHPDCDRAAPASVEQLAARAQELVQAHAAKELHIGIDWWFSDGGAQCMKWP